MLPVLLNFQGTDPILGMGSFSTVHKWVKDAVSERTKKDPADKKTCIRVTYADGYHIDLPIYIVKDDTAFLAHLSGGAWHH